jgi:hypothetical protein
LVRRGVFPRAANGHARKPGPPSRGQFLQRFFRSIAQIEVTETQSLDFWEQALARKRELSERIGKRVAFQAALVDVLASAISCVCRF